MLNKIMIDFIRIKFQYVTSYNISEGTEKQGQTGLLPAGQGNPEKLKP